MSPFERQIELAEALGSFLKCPTCGYILIVDASFKNKCPHCDHRLNVPNLLPSIEIELLISQKIFKFYDTEDKDLIPILFCTLFEMLFEEFLSNLMEKEGIQPKYKAAILERYSSIKDRVEDLFPRLTKITFKEALKGTEFQNFYSTWSKIKTVRNQFLHGRTGFIPEDIIEKSFQLTKTTIELFVFINNKFCVRHREQPNK